MAGELQAQHVTGATLYATLLDASGGVWNGTTFDATPTAGEWATYDLAMTEDGTTGYYRGNMPTVAEALYSYRVHKQLGGSPAPADPVVWTGEIDTSGVAIGQDSIDDIVAGLLGQGAFVSSPNQSPAVGSLGQFTRATTWIMPAIDVGALPADRLKLWFTVKTDPGLDDADATLMVEEDDGLLILNGAEAEDALAGSITYDDAEDELTPRFETDATEVVEPRSIYYFDVKYKTADGAEHYVPARGTFSVVWGITNAT